MKSLTNVAAVFERYRLWIAAVIVLALVGTVLGLTLPGSSGGSGLPANAAFSYRGSTVSVTALKQRMHLLNALYGVEEPSTSAAKDKFWRAAAQADAMSLILQHAAAVDGVSVTDQQANTALQQMISSQLSGAPGTSFDALLKKFGVSEADVLSEVKAQQEIGLLFQKVTQTASATPTSAEVESYFQTHTGDFDVPAKRHLLNIVVATRSEALTLITAAKKDDFGTLAKRYSLDDSTRSKGGNLGTVAASALDSAYAKAAFAAPVDGVFGPVQTTYGWNVGKVLSSAPARNVTLAQVRSSVVSAIKSSKALAAWKAWLSAQISEAGVRYADAYRPADPTSLPAMDLPSTPAS